MPSAIPMSVLKKSEDGNLREEYHVYIVITVVNTFKGFDFHIEKRRNKFGDVKIIKTNDRKSIEEGPLQGPYIT